MSLFSSLSVSASGMAAQRTRAALLVENIANSETTRTPEGGPYRRKDAIFSIDSGGFRVCLGARLSDADGRAGQRDFGRSKRPEKQYAPGIPMRTPMDMWTSPE